MLFFDCVFFFGSWVGFMMCLDATTMGNTVTETAVHWGKWMRGLCSEEVEGLVSCKSMVSMSNYRLGEPFNATCQPKSRPANL